MNLALVSGIFVAAGVLLLWIVNRTFATRLLGEYHPGLYKRPVISFLMLRLPYIIVLCFLPILITVVVQETKTTNPHILNNDSIILKVALAFFVAFTASPYFVLVWTYLIPSERTKEEIYEHQRRHGTGYTTTKILVIVTATSFLVTELAFRVATTLQTFPATNAPWYYSKATFYVAIPGFELIVLTLYAATRVDKLFYLHGPNEQLPGDREAEESEERVEMA